LLVLNGMREEVSQEAMERRRYARLDIAVSVSYSILNDVINAHQQITEALSSDISAGGLRMMTPSSLDNGSQLELEIFVGEEKIPIRANAEVVWQSRISETCYETGAIIRFMPEDDKKRFMGFVFDQMSRFVGIPETTLQ
jgi:c-di-GMP-binding flagellar brake protein YcgR